MERFFNTAGPNNIEDSYTLNPLARFDLDDIMTLIQQKRYFVLHAPRQTGKTSCMLALRDYLNAAGDSKIKRGALVTVINDGLRQTAEYMDRVGAVDEGHLIVFDRSKTKTWEERIWHKTYEYQGYQIMVWGM